MFLINTFLGFLLAQLADLLKRSKSSEASPERFSFNFFIADNWVKILCSLLISFSITTFMHINGIAPDKVWDLGFMSLPLLPILQGIIGFAPELALQYIKKNTDSFLQPEQVKGFVRKK